MHGCKGHYSISVKRFIYFTRENSKVVMMKEYHRRCVFHRQTTCLYITGDETN